MQYFSFLAPLAAFLLLSAALQNNEDIEARNSIFTRSEDELETIPAYANSLFARGEDEEDLHYVHPNYGCRACTCTARVIAPGNGDYFDIGNSNGKLLEALGKGNCATGGQMSDTSGFWEPLSKDRCTDASYKKCKAFSIRGWFQIYRLAGNGPSWSMLCLLLAATERTIQSRNPLSRRTRSLLPTLLNMAIRPALARKKLKSKERFKTYSARNTSDLTGQALWRYTGADTLRARPV
ncbi:uncharacterized protein SEPMUDRAFT_134258 [Sphaerulina musiva SO2202]|uniref:Uncharacterized protein n=1 Tax=Sphaerulina musiva (strain SO2202) TaxID=692275 RepID=M3CD90_SPHMS|nr:uncharacterized protein SEPMUDRAFT_134258 [Sphaerulina musiva SO2202]EMF11026.1 hypothetical protein SEPMUDRAFT_134258 [Sphaerulina musiva SO2202]